MFNQEELAEFRKTGLNPRQDPLASWAKLQENERIVECSKCKHLAFLRINLSPRSEDDKATVKVARTAWTCTECTTTIDGKEKPTHNELELKRDLSIDFDWITGELKKGGESK